MTPLVVIATLLCGAIGAVIRYLVTKALPVVPGHLPRGVLIVNVVGSLVGGLTLGLAERAAVSPEWQFVILSGVCAGLTTFSTWTVETIELAEGGRWRAAVLNIAVTLALGFAVTLGAYLSVR
ncbi:fluoride efflux transporter CrcB [Orlajensenia leifsoniae]|uniref:Fluoride-specific ion channel FluC n=1 Tax=Orlajensenia leifsoniae TaxID=2561933 RepID=A0A4Y9QWF0_9MICO|nr:fluoride efflux transporter CrcB [Leifsonia flava]TFV95295.1 fluoride efflux transporter CrcB [Leifsonia flava]